MPADDLRGGSTSGSSGDTKGSGTSSTGSGYGAAGSGSTGGGSPTGGNFGGSTGSGTGSMGSGGTGSMGSGGGTGSMGGSSTRPKEGNSTAGSGLMDTIRQQANSRLSSQKGRAADSLGSVVEAIRQTGQQLKDKNGTLAGYADNAATQVERFASSLRDRDVSDIVDDVKMFAQRRPAVFLGTGVAIGLIAARFLKSSAPSSGTGRGAQRFPSMGTQGGRWREGTTGMSGSPYSSGRRNTSIGMGTTAGTSSPALDIAADRPSSRPTSPSGTSQPRGRR